MDGDMITSCLTLAVMVDGHDITTVEGLAKNGELNPVQKSFIQYGGFQCGICTPGQVVAATALLDRESQTQRRRDQGLDDGQSLSLHGLLQDHRIDRESSPIRQIIRTQP